MPLPLEVAGHPEDRVLRQLVAALLFEGLTSFTVRGDDRVAFTLEEAIIAAARPSAHSVGFASDLDRSR
ncbi:hypothetical protein N7E02_00110 (plasmid) [Aliirhizobium terrae]|uniref:hypothetical protein n=1 Tax=Terrirhizobium terrae TaxID=2926709 RepID=UPI002578B9C5|nr:hypothetical protein [Rhizobium sp. CC-CFT758]WJH37891.1 hypothetical protein N7E02_00110 [Rhizobium sp. CC-CFT758]